MVVRANSGSGGGGSITYIDDTFTANNQAKTYTVNNGMVIGTSSDNTVLFLALIIKNGAVTQILYLTNYVTYTYSNGTLEITCKNANQFKRVYGEIVD